MHNMKHDTKSRVCGSLEIYSGARLRPCMTPFCSRTGAGSHDDLRSDPNHVAVNHFGSSTTPAGSTSLPVCALQNLYMSVQ